MEVGGVRWKRERHLQAKVFQRCRVLVVSVTRRLGSVLNHHDERVELVVAPLDHPVSHGSGTHPQKTMN